MKTTEQDIKDAIANTDWKAYEDRMHKNITYNDGGIISKSCPKCGGHIGISGGGILWETCSSCGEIYSESRYAK